MTNQRYCPIHHLWFNSCCWKCEEGYITPPHLKPVSDEELSEWRKSIRDQTDLERHWEQNV